MPSKRRQIACVLLLAATLALTCAACGEEGGDCNSANCNGCGGPDVSNVKFTFAPE